MTVVNDIHEISNFMDDIINNAIDPSEIEFKKLIGLILFTSRDKYCVLVTLFISHTVLSVLIYLFYLSLQVCIHVLLVIFGYFYQNT